MERRIIDKIILSIQANRFEGAESGIHRLGETPPTYAEFAFCCIFSLSPRVQPGAPSPPTWPQWSKTASTNLKSAATAAAPNPHEA